MNGSGLDGGSDSFFRDIATFNFGCELGGQSRAEIPKAGRQDMASTWLSVYNNMRNEARYILCDDICIFADANADGFITDDP